MFAKLATAALTAVSHLKGEEHPQQQQPQTPVPNLEYPGDNCCILYSDSGFSGETFYVCTGESYAHYNLHDYGFGDKVSSWICGKNKYYDICNDVNGSCINGGGVQGAGTIYNHHTGYEDSASELRMWNYDIKSTAAVITFQDSDCSYDSARYFADSEPGRKALYTDGDMWYHNDRNDEMSSIMIPFGYAVDLFENGSFNGASITLTGRAFEGVDMQIPCQDLHALGWGDKVSSLKVYKTDSLGIAQGYWRSITASEGFTYTIHAGFETSNTESTHTAEQFNLSYEMQWGMEFMGLSESETISSSYTQEIAKDTEESYTADISFDITHTCTAKSTDEGVGLWQWVSESADGQSRTLTDHTVCRYGNEHWNTSPACPWNACVDQECIECRGDWYQ